MEIWKNIEGYEELYQISNYGNVKSLDKKDSLNRKIKGKNLKIIKRKDGYLSVKLNKQSKSKEFLIHRLVATMFIPNLGKYKEINHKDENKQNNCVDNLEWCNRKYNINYGNANANRRKTLLNRRGKKVMQYDKSKKIIAQYSSVREASRKTNINIAGICDCCNNKRRTAGGYHWEYLQEQ